MFASGRTSIRPAIGAHVIPDWLIAFLRRELAPFPGRGIATCRIVVACVVTLVLCMTLRVPDAYLAVWVVFKIALEEPGETLLTGILCMATLTLAIAISLVLLFVSMDQPSLRFCLIGVTAAAAFYLRRVFAIGAVGFLFGLVPTVVLTLPDFIPTADRAVRLTLWLWPMFGLGVACAVAANLWVAPNDPLRLLREEFLRRVRAAEAAIAAGLGRPADARALAPVATLGIARMLGLLRSANIMHPSLRAQQGQQSALTTLTDRLQTTAAALRAVSVELSAGERARFEALADDCARVHRALESGAALAPTMEALETAAADRGSAALPVLVELENVVGHLRQVLGSDAIAIAAAAPEPERPALFVADAFTNIEYVQYALKGALSVLICYLAMNALDWPGIRTCYITVMIIGLTSDGATIQKGTLRIAGALLGGAMGFLAILVLIPNMESITSLAVLVAAGTAVAAWVYVGSARISYAGVQIALAFFICVVQAFEPSWYFYTIRDRMVGILLGNAVISLVFLSVWPIRAGTEMWMGLGAALRAMADLARVGGLSEDQAVVAHAIGGLRLRAYRHFAAAQQSGEEAAFEWLSRERGGMAHASFWRAISEAQSVFLTQLAIASQRPTVAPTDLPPALVAATRHFDSQVGECLDRIADRAAKRTPREIPELHEALTELVAVEEAELPRMTNREWANQVEGRLALYREVVSRLERLAASVGT